MPMHIICDIECYSNLFFIAFKCVENQKVVTFELSPRSPTIDLKRIEKILSGGTLVTFNGRSYDVPLIYGALKGWSNATLKRASDLIINGDPKTGERLPWWEIPKKLGVFIPKDLDHIDLFDTNPAVKQSLKTLNGRLHGERMQDLPYPPDGVLSEEEMDLTIDYCVNSDIPATERLFKALEEPLALRVALGEVYGQDFRSKSDAQMGEAIIRHRVEEEMGQQMVRPDNRGIRTFRYSPPDFIKFESPRLTQMVEMIKGLEFVTDRYGKPILPKAISGVAIGDMFYAMGIGGLHSTETSRAVHSDEDYVLVDADVASQYPSIIMKLGLYPEAVGPLFLKVYGAMKDERIVAKRVGDKVKDKGFKIALNGGGYGKLGSPHSFLYAPHLMIAVTLTGQLSLLMLIERANKAGIEVVSANTDGIVFRCPRDYYEGLEKVSLKPSILASVTAQWEAETGFELEFAEYRSVYSRSVNDYVAITPEGKTKIKGPMGNPWREGDLRSQMMKNPQATICSDAVREYLMDLESEDADTFSSEFRDHRMDGIIKERLRKTITASTDIRDFVTVINATGGATWRGQYQGKVVRFYWALGGEAMTKPAALTKTYKEALANWRASGKIGPEPARGTMKVSGTDGCKPLMVLPDQFPDDIDYERYVNEAFALLEAFGKLKKREKFRITKKDSLAVLLGFDAALI